jgi:hypothetical protein
MEDKNILQNAADAIAQEPVILRITLKHEEKLDRLKIKLGIKKPYRDFKVKPLVLGKMMQISKLLIDIDLSGNHISKDPLGQINKISMQHTETLAQIVAIALHPGKKTPGSLVRFLLDNLEIKELERVALIVLKSLEIQSFLNTIITLKGVQILKSGVSPADQVEKIAPGVSSAV